MSKMQIGRLSKKEYLLGYDKYSSNMSSNDQSDLPMIETCIMNI